MSELKTNSFWMVLSERSSETRVRHQTFLEAQQEARRLASANMGTKFYVLQSVGHAIRDEPTSWHEHETDPIPF